MKAFDKVDIIVNNAGISRAMPFDKITDQILHDDLELKLFAAVRLIRLVVPQMKEQRWGRIINVLNIGAKAPRIQQHADVGFARGRPGDDQSAIARVGAAQRTGDRHARRLNSRRPACAACKAGQCAGRGVLQDARTGHLLKRVGEAEEFANLACFLASEQGGYITGTAINVDGGRSPVV